jgi:quercetin dioxygenase-like cupin family protein
MRTDRFCTTIATAALALGLALPAVAADEHVMVTPDAIAWQAAPAALPSGAEAAVLFGNPAEEGLFALRVKMPEGYAIPPHTHPAIEAVTVISGTLRFGMGETADRAKAEPPTAGTFFAMPPGTPHFVFADEETVIQISTNGPWGLTYVDPKDDPRTQ